MAKADQRMESAANPAFLDAFAGVSEAVESGAGLPELARATARALEASVAVVDASANVLAVACASPDEERAVLSSGEVLELRVADTTVGQLRYRARGEPPPTALLRPRAGDRHAAAPAQVAAELLGPGDDVLAIGDAPG